MAFHYLGSQLSSNTCEFWMKKWSFWEACMQFFHAFFSSISLWYLKTVSTSLRLEPSLGCRTVNMMSRKSARSRLLWKECTIRNDRIPNLVTASIMHLATVFLLVQFIIFCVVYKLCFIIGMGNRPTVSEYSGAYIWQFYYRTARQRSWSEVRNTAWKGGYICDDLKSFCCDAFSFLELKCNNGIHGTLRHRCQILKVAEWNIIFIRERLAVHRWASNW